MAANKNEKRPMSVEDIEALRQWKGAVVVGVSTRSGSPAALAWGLAEARRRNCTMIALTAFWPPSSAAGTLRPTPARTAGSSEIMGRAAVSDLRRWVRRALGPDAEDAPDVELAAVRGSRQDVLVRASQDASLLVVDAPSVNPEPLFASSLLHRAHCPVVVMPRPVLRGHGHIHGPESGTAEGAGAEAAGPEQPVTGTPVPEPDVADVPTESRSSTRHSAQPEGTD